MTGQDPEQAPVVDVTNAAASPATPVDYFAGVDVGDALIRAGVFDDAMRFLGKSKRSTKRERGQQAVMARIARCIEDAADECDLSLSQIQAVGVGLRGLPGAHGNSVISAPRAGWDNLALREELQMLLGRPVFLGTHHQLSALGISASELQVPPRIFAALFPGLEIGGGLLFAGETPPEAELKQFQEIVERSQLDLANDSDRASVARLPGRKLRKAVRRGDPAAMAFALNVGKHTGQAIARIVETFHPDTVALGGGVVEEMKQEMVTVVVNAASKELGRDIGTEVLLVVSCLGDAACLAGGASLARKRLCADTIAKLT